MKLYYHKTDGGAEYLTDRFIECPNGHKEGIFEGANYIVRIDGDIEKGAELTARDTAAHDLLEALKNIIESPQIKSLYETATYGPAMRDRYDAALYAIAKAEGR